MKIAVINTGGTISCVGEPLSPMSADEFATASQALLGPILLQRFPNLAINYLTSIAFSESCTNTLDSTNLQPKDWCILAKGILENYADYDGFIVLHGTDSMDFTGGALPFLLNTFDLQGLGTAVLSKPVIITGSQVPLFYRKTPRQSLSLNFNTDAYQNMCGAIASARTGIPEVCVYFQNHLYRSSRVLKTNASEFDAFSSPNYPDLAEHGIELELHEENWLPGPVRAGVSLDNAKVLKQQLALINTISSIVEQFPIAQLNAFPAHYSVSEGSAFMANIVSAFVSAGAKGLILQAYGEGNFPSGNPDSPSQGAVFQALHEAHISGVDIVDCTRVISGSVNNTSYASGAWLPQVGALNSADMSPMTALAKLMILKSIGLANNWSREQIHTLFQANLLGEMESIDHLDSRSNCILMPGQSITSLDRSVSLVNDPILGPYLKNNALGSTLWQMLDSPSDADLPGRLIMRNDGNLVFYSRYNKALWKSHAGDSSGTASRLRLSIHTQKDTQKPGLSEGSVLLYIYNCVDGKISATVYQS